ncbi:hypothetical protein VTL71DRAFT_8934 [Oculimacula yallundae]|uniref:Uncharacterized protein n=1 Tax=Oculimacula yallundae TaxID=86028 RepID=A0ABR4BT99_9HELO
MAHPTPTRIVHLSRMAVAYPPADHFIAENPAILQRWEHDMAANPLGDPRIHNGKPYPTHLLDVTKLLFVIRPTDNITFVDADTNKVIGSVFHDLIGDAPLLKVLNGTVTDHLNKVQKTLRDNEAGYIVGVGYTSGARSARSLAWGNNLARSTSDEDRRHHAYKMSSVFAHVWKLAKKVLPQAVSDDFEEAILELGGLRMDGGVRGQAKGTLKYTIVVEGEERPFEASDLAPPAGMCGFSYSCQEYGGNFFMADYGILIPAFVDQLVSWKGQDLHGTALTLNDPFERNPDFKQIGIAFILPSGIKAELEKERSLGGHINMPEAFDPAKGLVSSVILNDANVQPAPRPSMVKRAVKEKATVYKKDRKESFALPDSHAYSKWGKRQLLDECTSRKRVGKLEYFATSWLVPKLQATLLRNDGVNVASTSMAPARNATIDTGMDVMGDSKLNASQEDDEMEDEEVEFVRGSSVDPTVG